MKPDFWYPGFGNDWLENFHEIEAMKLDSLSLLPTAPGALLIILAALGFVAFHLLKKRRRWLAMAFQRDALRLLEDTEQQYSKDSARSLTKLNQILKRCVLHLADRRVVASMTGNMWCEYLLNIQTCPEGDKYCLTEIDLRLIESCTYSNSKVAMTREEALLLIEKVRCWVQSLPVPQTKSTKLLPNRDSYPGVKK